MAEKLFESYKWLMPVEPGNDRGGSKIILRGKALTPCVSGNLRRYIDEELLRSARSLANKPIDVNHELSTWERAKAAFDSQESAASPGPRPTLKGHVFDAEYEDRAIEWTGECNHPEYVDKLRDGKRLTDEAYLAKWHKSKIKHVSVDANYRFHTKQGDVLEPHGLIFNALSLVEDPERPGDPSSSVEVLSETVEDQSRHIVETILRDKNIPFVERGGLFYGEGEEEDPLDARDRRMDLEDEKYQSWLAGRKALEEQARLQRGFSEAQWKSVKPGIKEGFVNALPVEDSKPVVADASVPVVAESVKPVESDVQRLQQIVAEQGQAIESKDHLINKASELHDEHSRELLSLRETTAKHQSVLEIMARMLVELKAAQAEKRSVVTETMGSLSGTVDGLDARLSVVEARVNRPVFKAGFQTQPLEPDSGTVAPPDKIRAVGRLDPNNG